MADLFVSIFLSGAGNVTEEEGEEGRQVCGGASAALTVISHGKDTWSRYKSLAIQLFRRHQTSTYTH